MQPQPDPGRGLQREQNSKAVPRATRGPGFLYQGKSAGGLPRWLSGKDSVCNAQDSSSIPGSGRSPGGRNGTSLHCSYLEKPHRQRSLVGHSPWGHKESDTTEKLKNDLEVSRSKLPGIFRASGVLRRQVSGEGAAVLAAMLSPGALGSYHTACLSCENFEVNNTSAI